MPNVLDIEPLRAFARRVAAKIADKRIAARFERLAITRLLQDQRNFREATDHDLKDAPEWTRFARFRGDPIAVFKLDRGAGQRLHNLARRLEYTRKLAALDVAVRPASVAHVNAAREFIDKLERADFETTRRKAYHFARLLDFCADTEDSKHVCPARRLQMTSGRYWERITSVNELRGVGREFGNCLARTTRTSVYGGGLYRGERQFWVLRESNDVGRIVVMVDAPRATALMEVRGPRNSRISPANADLMLLARVLGIRTPPPPPSPPPGVAAAVLLARSACLCMLCAPKLPLRLAAAAL
jgi:hypothetical protein